MEDLQTFLSVVIQENTTHMAQILQSLNYKKCSMILPEFSTFELFILILGASSTMDQTASCYVVTTSEIGLLNFFYDANSFDS